MFYENENEEFFNFGFGSGVGRMCQWGVGDQWQRTIPAVPSGQTILFSNNTALTIGDADGVQTRAMEGSMELRENVNEACNLELEEVPSIPDEVATLSDKQFNGWDVPSYVPKEGVYTIDGGTIRKDIFVDGTLYVKKYTGKGGRIIVKDGGTVILKVMFLRR